MNPTLKTIFKNEVLNSGVDRTSCKAIQLSIADLIKEYAAIDEFLHQALSIITAADTGSEIYDQIKSVKESSHYCQKLLNDLSLILQNIEALFEGRKCLFFQPNMAWQFYNTSFNQNFKLSICNQRINISFEPLLHPQNQKPIVENYYLLIVPFDSSCTIQEVENALMIEKHELILLHIDHHSKEVDYQLDFNAVKTLKGDALKTHQSYQSHLFATFSLDYKKEINNYEDYLSYASFPFEGSADFNVYTLKQVADQYQKCLSQFDFLEQCLLKAQSVVLRQKGVNPLIPNALVDALANTATAMCKTQQQKANVLRQIGTLIK